MTIDIALVGTIFFAAIALFISEKVRVDVVALITLSLLLLLQLVTVEEAFAGFSNPAVVTVWAVFIVSAAVQRSGVADLLAVRLLRLAGDSEIGLLIVLMLISAVISSVMNNVGAVAILLPPTISIARQRNIAPSRFLMPISFAALLGGNLTLIGTPPNMLAGGLLSARGLQPFSFFDFTPMGAIVLTVGVLYMIFIGRRLLPDRPAGKSLATDYALHNYLAELRVEAASPLLAGTLAEQHIQERHGVTILYMRRNGEPSALRPFGDRMLQTDDILLVEGPMAAIISFGKRMRAEMVRDFSETTWAGAIDTPNLHLREVAIAPRSLLAGQTLQSIDFRSRYGVSVLALRHGNQGVATELASTTLSVGDVLLLQGSDHDIDLLKADRDFLVLSRQAFEPPPESTKALLTLAILAGVIISAIAGWLQIPAAMMIGALLTVLFGIQTIEQAHLAIDWKVVFLIAAMLPLGTAMETSGAAAYVAEGVIGRVGSYGPIIILAGIVVLTGLLTEVISNAAATVLIGPIAIEIALQLGGNPHSYLLAIVLAASTSFLTPIGHQCNVIIFSPGGYKFSDYARVGAGLNVIIWLLIILVMPLLWPLSG